MPFKMFFSFSIRLRILRDQVFKLDSKVLLLLALKKLLWGHLGGPDGQASASGSGHDPRVPEPSIAPGPPPSREPAPPSGPPASHALSLYLILSLKQIKILKKKRS